MLRLSATAQANQRMRALMVCERRRAIADIRNTATPRDTSKSLNPRRLGTNLSSPRSVVSCNASAEADERTDLPLRF